jgi:5'-nucleotidase (lipoprotein e(P4) family)
MMTETGVRPAGWRAITLAFAAALAIGLAACATKEQTTAEVPANDNLNAVLWTQRAVEFKGNAETAFALARIRLDQALRNRKWTAAPAEQTGSYRSLPPAVVLDVDETLLDNSAYQAWNIVDNTSFDPKTWTAFVKSEISVPIPGAVEFTKYAASKGVKVFYVTNRTSEEEAATRENLEKFGFPMGGNVDTLLTAGEKPEWKSAKSTRRAFIAKDYRILLLVGDNLGDFTDDYKGDDAARLKVWEANKDHWGHDWIVIANPTYGSFESSPYNNDFKLSDNDKRKAKRDVLWTWPGPQSQ